MNTMTMANALKAVFGAQTLTTASYFPACAQDGTPSGVISAANLASVLGVVPKGNDVCSNVDNEVTTGFWTMNGYTGGQQPSTTEGYVLLVIGDNDYVGQIAIGCVTNKAFHRSKLNRSGVEWNTWVQF